MPLHQTNTAGHSSARTAFEGNNDFKGRNDGKGEWRGGRWKGGEVRDGECKVHKVYGMLSGWWKIGRVEVRDTGWKSEPWWMLSG